MCVTFWEHLPIFYRLCEPWSSFSCPFNFPFSPFRVLPRRESKLPFTFFVSFFPPPLFFPRQQPHHFAWPESLSFSSYLCLLCWELPSSFSLHFLTHLDLCLQKGREDEEAKNADRQKSGLFLAFLPSPFSRSVSFFLLPISPSPNSFYLLSLSAFLSLPLPPFLVRRFRSPFFARSVGRRIDHVQIDFARDWT